MQDNPIKIEIYDKRLKMSTTIFVDKVSDNIFRAVENELFNCRLTLGTEFETRINKDGKHEIIRIVRDSEYITKRFFLTSQFNQSEYRLLGDEIIKQGGFWQVDFGGIATVNLPKNCNLDLDDIFKTFDFYPTYIVDE
jgi:hypothetical protein